MRVITHCPACQTQFFATEEQLNKHGGKVRCGQCMHVFDAKAQLVTVSTEDLENTGNSDTNAADNTSSYDTPTPELNTSHDTSASDVTVNATTETVRDDLNLTPVNHNTMQQPSYLADAVINSRFGIKRFSDTSHRWPWLLISLILVFAACAQSFYFLRDEIAIYYPGSKPLLIKICQKIGCSINLPKQIEFIVIDDSDMQEDTDHSGLVRFSSTLLNSGTHVLAYPDLELTLTDVDDKPVLRRVFKPQEYLPANTNVADGMKAHEEIRIKLAMTTDNIAVAGYRVFVTY